MASFYSSTRQQIQETKAQSFISRRIHFLDPTIRTAELIFAKAIILNAKSLDRNCSSIMLRRGTITRILVGLKQTLRISSANRKLFPNPVGRTARTSLPSSRHSIASVRSLLRTSLFSVSFCKTFNYIRIDFRCFPLPFI